MIVVGLGNPILSDDCVGLRVAEALRQRIDCEDIAIIDTSIAGLDFLDLLAGYDRAIIIDAIQTGEGKAGQIYRLEPGSFRATRHATTPHDVNFATALELGRRLGLPLPKDITIFGIEVQDVVNLGETCTSAVEKAIPVCADMVLNELSSKGCPAD